ncbi:sulfurtransferase TusA family protein [Oceanobacillus massiliensis]|uniref:sulfurtransferase TusA family protein n=1 Tax=Oceanobacillus massiliensis TaxID=1465765 RepID=UPI003017B236
MSIVANEVLDAKGLVCPMPIVKTKKAITNLDPGKVLEVQATDRGSTADLKAWSEGTGHQYLGTVEEDGVLKHYIRGANDYETKDEKKFEHVVELKELQKKIEKDENTAVLDVREPAEYAFGHIPKAKNIPLGELDDRIDEVESDKELFIICRTGSRSDLAAQKLAKKGIKNIKNVVPGMLQWKGPTEKN